MSITQVENKLLNLVYDLSVYSCCDNIQRAQRFQRLSIIAETLQYA